MGSVVDTPPPVDSAEALIEDLVGSFAFTEQQATVLVYHDIYGFDKDTIATYLETSRDSVRNTAPEARNKATVILDLADALAGITGMTLSADADYGGELGAVITDLVESPVWCPSCEQIHHIGTDVAFRGRFHRSGLRDGDGKRWWLYITCPQTGIDVAWPKLQHYQLDDPQTYHTRVAETKLRDGADHALVFTVESEDGVPYADSHFYIASDGEQARDLGVECRTDNWQSTRHSIWEWERDENITVVPRDTTAPPFTHTGTFVGPAPDSETARPPFTVALTYDHAAVTFTATVTDTAREWYRLSIPLADVGLDAVPLES